MHLNRRPSEFTSLAPGWDDADTPRSRSVPPLRRVSSSPGHYTPRKDVYAPYMPPVEPDLPPKLNSRLCHMIHMMHTPVG